MTFPNNAIESVKRIEANAHYDTDSATLTHS
jgi:hypothetical protein